MNNDNGVKVENEYSKSYSKKSLFDKIKWVAKKAGISVVYAALLLYFVLQKRDIPAWAKATIIGSLGYFIVPVDAIPDTIPVVGLTDDLGVLVAALVSIAMFVDDEVKKKARNKLKDWFGDYDEASLNDIDSKIHRNRKIKGEIETEG